MQSVLILLGYFIFTVDMKSGNKLKSGKTMIKNIFPTNNPPKKEYLVTITEEISKFVIENYHDTFDPTIQYSDGTKAYIGWSTRKNASIGVCRRIPRVIYYNGAKIGNLDYSELIDLRIA